MNNKFSLSFLMAIFILAPNMFAQELTVCSSGCDETSIQSAVNNIPAGGTVSILDAVHTEVGIVVAKSMTIRGLGMNSTIVQADSVPGATTGIIFTLSAGSITLEDLTIRNATAFEGSAIFGQGPTDVTLRNCHITQNSGLSCPTVFYGVSVVIENSLLTNNQADQNPSALCIQGDLHITDSTISGNNGPRGAVGIIGNLLAEGCTFTLNGFAGLDLFAGTVNIINSTFSGNNGQGISAGGVPVTMINCTVTGNTVGISGGASLSVGNSIVAGNGTDMTTPPGAVTALGPNLCGDASCGNFSILNGNADLLPLANNGGSTQTHDLGPASEARDAGLDSIAPSTDQAGNPRPLGAASDLGAYESLADSDGDGVSDDDDDCPDSDTNPTVVINFCDTGVTNYVDADGCTLADTLAQCAEGNPYCWEYESCISQLTADLVSQLLLTSAERDAVRDCARDWGLPNPEDDEYTTDWSNQLCVGAPGLLANDTDPQGDSLETHLQSGPANGTLSLARDGSFCYTPTAGFTGPVTFVYKAWDGSKFRTATATINVTEGNQYPVAGDDEYTVTAGTRYTQAAPGVLANDHDPEGNQLVAHLVSNPAVGQLGFHQDGSFWCDAPVGYSGDVTFTYNSSDGELKTLATVTLHIQP